MNQDASLVDLPKLVALFYSPASELGEFQVVEPDSTPPKYRELLDHHAHMTVTLERFHDCKVELKVLATARAGDHYARKIILTRPADRRCVLFGIVRMNLNLLPISVNAEIWNEETPLGHILIRHNVLREVERLQLVRVIPGPELRQLWDLEPQDEIFGRTAMIYCNREPAIELLELVGP